MYPSTSSVISDHSELSPSQPRDLSTTTVGKEASPTSITNITNIVPVQASIADGRTTPHVMLMLIDMCQAMAEVGMPLLVHGEVTRAGVDIFDKEAKFIEEVMKV